MCALKSVLITHLEKKKIALGPMDRVCVLYWQFSFNLRRLAWNFRHWQCREVFYTTGWLAGCGSARSARVRGVMSLVRSRVSGAERHGSLTRDGTPRTLVDPQPPDGIKHLLILLAIKNNLQNIKRSDYSRGSFSHLTKISSYNLWGLTLGHFSVRYVCFIHKTELL